MKRMNVGFSIHRPEIIPITEGIMDRHEVIFLEEPPSPGFEKMLDRTLGVEEYLMPLDMEYPEFSRTMCHLEIKLHAKGKRLIQVEPFVEALLSIHDFLALGNRPEDLEKRSVQYFVYITERNATAALLNFYKTSMTGSFENTVKAIRQFAQADAARFRLRDSLRAQEIIRQSGKYNHIFVEAGMIHYQLWQLLWRQLSGSFKVQPVFLDRFALKGLNSHHHSYSPGDLLTLAHIFHPCLSLEKWESLMAARSIIYSKIIQKQEFHGDPTNFFHLTDETNCIRISRGLSMDDCRRLYPLIRSADTSKARRVVEQELMARQPAGSKAPIFPQKA
ncbi:conserved hypothetical protein [Desulforapulum autotrophicum HRM2]|uniref:Uncharacterized protein n=1 Tax=Desulforapulum autotrophicum (strain ATCC 43914 / DSM 3382 / VKM B-1955 / HRM2) TaxID=177437 RepID=C0QLJ8_DESAH|nr:hypothetical protein [Desulforapulum autotrophicum]ACN16302.1 conserved hypothetical protein [Desulforapulum autotrophicum HRM2]